MNQVLSELALVAATGEVEGALYILMRTDLASMNPGKAVIQGSHAANQFMSEMESSGLPAESPIMLVYRRWKESADGFGVGICLGVNEAEMRKAVQIGQLFMRAGQVIAADITHDPSYPLLDGAFVHHIPLDTCAFVFGDKAICALFLGHLKLMP